MSGQTLDIGFTNDTWRWLLIGAIVLLISCCALAVTQFRRFTEASDTAERADQAIGTIDSLLARLTNAETGQRGFLLTNDPTFIEPYERIREESTPLVQLVTSLVSTDQSQRLVSGRLGPLVEMKIDEMEATVRLHRGGDPAAAVRLVSEGQGKRLMDSIRAIAMSLRANERALLATREHEASLSRRNALIFSGATLFVAIALTFAAVSIQRTFGRRAAQVSEEQRARLSAQQEALEASTELQQSERFTRGILDSSGDCIAVLKLDGTIALVNQPGLELLDIGNILTVQGQPWASWWGLSAGLAQQAIDAALQQGEGRFQAPRFTPSGSTTWWDVLVTPVRDHFGHVVTLVTIARDITQQKHTEEERAHLLASERAARSEAERAARMKDEFVSTLSHELRTPLNAILGWVGVLKQDRTPDTTAKALDVIDRNSRRQAQMIDDLLDISRIMSGKLRLDVQRLDLASVVEEAMASAKPAADAKGVGLTQVFGSAAIIQGDPGRLQQIVWNLVSNAIKFTPRGGNVQVTLRKVNSQVHIQVSDTGQGIRNDVLPHVFQRFRQGDATSTRIHGGLGLGLAIVKNLVEMHGGSVEGVSEGEGRGSVFTVRLPLALAQPRQEPSVDTLHLLPADFASLLSGVTTLVVDDEPDARELVQRLLEDAGARVRTAASAREALAEIEDGLVPDIIISDIGMPHEDGYEFMQRVRRMPSAASAAPAAALTALARVEDRKRALMAGYQTHLAKPVDPAELVAMVASLTGRTGRSDS